MLPPTYFFVKLACMLSQVTALKWSCWKTNWRVLAVPKALHVKKLKLAITGSMGWSCKTGAAGMCRQPAKSKGEVGKTGAARMCRQPAKSSYYGMRGWSWENLSCRNVQASSKKKLLWIERVELGKLEPQECADNQQKERVKLGKLELQECADNQQKAVIMEWEGEVGKTWVAGMCRQAAKRSYYGLKGWSWGNWSCRNGQTTSKKKLLWNSEQTCAHEPALACRCDMSLHRLESTWACRGCSKTRL